MNTRQRTTMVHRLWMPILVIVALMGSVGVAKIAGSWQTSGRGQVLLDASGQPDPFGIKGWMTLIEVSETYDVPLDDLYALIGAGGDVPPTTAMKDLERLLPGIEVWAVREVVAAYQAGVFAPLQRTDSSSLQQGDAGQQHAAESAGQGQPLPEDGAALPASEIRGRFTLLETSELCQVPLETLIAELGLPEDVKPMLRLSSLPDELGIEISAVRDVVAAYQAHQQRRAPLDLRTSNKVI